MASISALVEDLKILQKYELQAIRRPHQTRKRDLQRRPLMTDLRYEHITKRAEREIRDSMQRAAACEIGTYSLGLAVGEDCGAMALWDALAATLDASAVAGARAGRARIEALAYAKRSPTA